MPKASPAQVSFNAGELSPRLEGRVDLAKYGNGCQRLENFLPLVQGGVTKRSGFRHVKEVRDSAAATRLIRFEFGTTQAYVLEFGNLYARVYYNSGGALETGVAITAVAATTPIRITAAGHGLATGDQTFISGTAIAGINQSFFAVTFVSATQFDLNGTSSLGAGGAGGTSSRVFQFVTPYTTADLPALQIAQSADVLYLAHPAHAPRKLTRTGHTSWTLTVISFTNPAFSQENTDQAEYMVASGRTGSVQVYSTGGRFLNPAHVGCHVSLAEDLESRYPEWQPAINTTGSTNFGLADYDNEAFATGNNLRSHYQGRLYRFVAVGSGGGQASSGGSPPLHESGSQTDGQYFWEYVNSGYGWVEITAVTDAWRAVGTVRREFGYVCSQIEYAITAITHAGAVGTFTVGAHRMNVGDTVFVRGTLNAALNNRTYVITAIAATTWSATTNSSGTSGAGGITIRVQSGAAASVNPPNQQSAQCTRWAFSAWGLNDGGNARGFPSAVAFFENRLWWAGTAGDPQGLWASRTGRYEDHLKTPDEDDGALLLLLNTQQVNKIEWLSASKVLIAGTSGGEFLIGGSGNAAITAGNAAANQHSFYGSRAAVAPLRVENVTLFVQRAGRKLIEFSFNFENDSFIGSDLTVLADHIALARMKELAWAQEPDRIVWAVLDDGQLVAMTYDRKQDVIGWHRHPVAGTGALVESIAVIPHPDGDRDQLWAIVRRTIGAVTRRYVEHLEETWIRGTPLADALFVDAGATYSGAPTVTVTGLWYLVGETVSALADALVIEGLVVSATGQISLPAAASKVQVGLPYAATLSTMRIEAGARDGVAQGKWKRITNAVLRVEETGRGLFYGAVVSRVDEHLIESGILFGGDTPILPWPEGYEQEARVVVRHTKPTPCTVLAIFPQVVTEDR